MKTCRSIISLAALSFVAACGGGKSDSNTEVPSIQLTGTVASGAAWSGATVQVSDRQGNEVCTETTSDSGKYSCAVPASTEYPLVVKAKNQDLINYSIAASKDQNIANVSQLTTLVVANLVENGNVANLYENIKNKPELFAAEKISVAKEKVNKIIQPIADQVNANQDFLVGAFEPDGTGIDKVLDLIEVDIKPTSEGYANIEASYKVAPSGAFASLTNLKLRSTSNAAEISPPSIDADRVPSFNLMGIFKAFIDKNNLCYQQPLAQRAEGGVIKSQECLALFVDGDPSSYLHQTTRVGVGAFSDLLNAEAGKITFESAELRDYFVRDDGNRDLDVVVRGKLKDGTPFKLDGVVLREKNGELFWFGDQNPHWIRVMPSARKTTRLVNIDGGGNIVGSSAFTGSVTQPTDWWGSGWVVSIRDELKNGVSIFKKVTVTVAGLPSLTYEYAPTSGRSWLTDPGKPCCSGRWVAYRYMDDINGANSADIPSVESSLLIAPTSLSASAIEGIPKLRTWTVKVEYADGSVKQYPVKSRNRPLTIEEITAKNMFTNFTPQYLLDLKSAHKLGGLVNRLDPNLVWGSSSAFALSTKTGGDAWIARGEGEYAPHTAIIYGVNNVPQGIWDDSVGLGGINQKLTSRVACANYSVTDKHCDDLGYADRSVLTDVSIENTPTDGDYATILYTNHITMYNPSR